MVRVGASHSYSLNVIPADDAKETNGAAAAFGGGDPFPEMNETKKRQRVRNLIKQGKQKTLHFTASQTWTYPFSIVARCAVLAGENEAGAEDGKLVALAEKIEKIVYNHRKGRGADEKYLNYARSLLSALKGTQQMRKRVLEGEADGVLNDFFKA